MKRKIKIQKIFAILLFTIFVLSLCSCGKKTVDVEIITHERSVKNTDRVTTDYLVLGEGEKFENLKVISIDKNTVTFSFNLEEKKTKYGEFNTFDIVVFDHGTYTYEIKFSKK